MTYAWNDDLATGNINIDNQHKQLVKSVNELMEACAGGHGREKLNSIMQFLISYTVQHFKDEEKLQQQYRYPDFPGHRKLHEDFKVSVTAMAKQLNAEGPTVGLVAKVNSGVGGWLVTHIQREDKKIAEYIKKQGG
jgi:hemerythrin